MKEVGILFDLDGTLLYTDELIKETFKVVFKKYKPGYNLTEAELLSFLGLSLSDSFSRYFDEKLIDELIDYYHEFNHSHHLEYVYVYPKAVETLDYLKQQGYRMAVVTTKLSIAAKIGIDTFGLNKYFEEIIALDNVSNTKPDPEGIFKAMKALNVNQAVMIGDNVSDIMAGKNAGIKTIAVKWSPKGYQAMEALKPDLLIEQMDEIIPFIETEEF